MIRVNVTGRAQAIKNLKKAKQKVIDRLRFKIIFSTQYTHKNVSALTAVWSGTSLANWRWTSTDRFNWSPRKNVGGSNPAKYGRTSEMLLGEEPMRPANQAVTDANFTRMKIPKKDIFRTYTLYNPYFVAELMERGKAPDEARARTEKMVENTRRSLVSYIRSL